MSKILITGVTGQDGFYLSQIARDSGHEVYGMVHGQNNPKEQAVREALPFVRIVYGDLLDAFSLNRLIEDVRPDIVVNLGAITYVPFSWQQPELVFKTNAMGVMNLLNACRESDSVIVQASTSEMFGNQTYHIIDEESPMNPVSPYGIAKLAAHHLCLNYRIAYGMQIVSAIMFNHESPMRGPQFVTRKITMAAARIRHALDAGEQPEPLVLGNLDARRDWGYSPDYMSAVLKLAEGHPNGGAYVIATGIAASVGEFAAEAFKTVGLDWRDWTKTDAANTRPNELNYLKGNARRAFLAVNWKASIKWDALAKLMTEADLCKL